MAEVPRPPRRGPLRGAVGRFLGLGDDPEPEEEPATEMVVDLRRDAPAADAVPSVADLGVGPRGDDGPVDAGDADALATVAEARDDAEEAAMVAEARHLAARRKADAARRRLDDVIALLARGDLASASVRTAEAADRAVVAEVKARAAADSAVEAADAGAAAKATSDLVIDAASFAEAGRLASEAIMAGQLAGLHAAEAWEAADEARATALQAAALVAAHDDDGSTARGDAA